MKTSETGRLGVFQSMLAKVMGYFLRNEGVPVPEPQEEVVPLPFKVVVTAATRKDGKLQWLSPARLDVKAPKGCTVSDAHKEEASEMAWTAYSGLERRVRRTSPGDLRLVSVKFEFGLRDGTVVLLRPTAANDMVIHKGASGNTFQRFRNEGHIVSSFAEANMEYIRAA